MSGEAVERFRRDGYTMGNVINDGSNAPPRLRVDLNSGNLAGLPPTSLAPSGDWSAIYAGVRAAGYEGLQHPVPVKKALAVGLRMTGSARVIEPTGFDAIAAQHKAWGFDASTLHVGTGLDSDGEMDRLTGALLEASERHAYPMFVETHRATMTQDMRRTLDLVERFPELRFNADLSHWYTGHELPYGDLPAKLNMLTPVFARVRFFHGRIGDSCAIQRTTGAPDSEPAYVGHFRDMWTRCFRGFLASASPGDVIVFTPELLPAEMSFNGHTLALNYARVLSPGVEETDRWSEALRLCVIARECFAAASLPGGA